MLLSNNSTTYLHVVDLNAQRLGHKQTEARLKKHSTPLSCAVCLDYNAKYLLERNETYCRFTLVQMSEIPEKQRYYSNCKIMHSFARLFQLQEMCYQIDDLKVLN